MTPPLTVAAALGAVAWSLLFTLAPARAADACDALTARMIRATGASLAGRTGSLAVFRAADADRMSLDCRLPRRMTFGAREREPLAPYFVLIGLSAERLTGARAGTVEVLARQLHQDSLLADAPRQGVAGRAALRCETGPREDDLAGNLTVCVLAPSRPQGVHRHGAQGSPVLRRRAGLFAGPRAG